MFKLGFQEQVVAVFLIFLMAVLLHHIVSWTGSLVNSMTIFGGSKYAVFTFRDDIDLPMSKNIFMNICIPNIALIVIYMIAIKGDWQQVLEQLWWFVPFYYLYRAFLICVVLRRKELYNVQYELFMFTCTVIAEYFIWKYFLTSENNLFIPISELRNEIWLVILVIVYKFIEMIVDKVAHQKGAVTESMMKKYIVKKFKEFYKKYNDYLQINYDNRIICILLYAIMIYENFNRGGIIRFFEYIKVSLGKTATVGIMQVTSDTYLSNEESITKAYKMLEKDIFVEDKQIDDDQQIMWYAFQYNGSDDYAKSVVFIYRHLKEYLIMSPRYKNAFCLDNEETRTQQLDTTLVENEKCAEKILEKQVKWLTIWDVEQMTGLKKKEILRIQRKNKAMILFDREEVGENFKEYLEKKVVKQ